MKKILFLSAFYDANIKNTKFGTVGCVALDKNGNMSFEFNTAGVYRASVDDKGNLAVKIYKD